MPKPILTLLFRDKRKANHSIERLFAALEPHFAEEFELRKVVVPRQPNGLTAMLANIRHARKYARGLIHVTGDAQYLVTFLPRRRTILTIHDCGYLEKLRGLKKIIYKWIWFKLPCLFATKVTVISQATKEVLEREIGVIGDKLTVIENCATVEMGRTKRVFDEGCPRILQIGSGRHKNLDNLIRAVEGLHCELHIVGRISEENMQALAAGGIRYKNEFAVSDERLRQIYHDVDILFFASRYEGFGLPILEGNGVGIPVITSNRLSMPWVAGDAAFIVNPESPQEIRAALDQTIDDAALRQHIVSLGFENTKRFSAQAVSEKYMKIYKQASGCVQCYEEEKNS